MVDENDRQFFRGGPYNGVQPEYFLTWNVGRPHAQAWSGTTTDEAYSLPIVAEVGCLENLVEHGAAVFAPVHVVVSRQQQIRFPEAFQYFLQQQELFCITEFGDISTENREVHGRIGIDVLDGLPEVVLGISEGIEVYIAEPGESERDAVTLSVR